MTCKTIEYKKQGPIAHIVLSRPTADNQVNEELVAELDDLCGQIEQDETVSVVIVTGAGRCFSAGPDTRQAVLAGCGAAAAIGRMERIVLAAINGDALGPGLELALACDIRIAASGARLGLPHARLGLVPRDGGSQRLPRIVGRAKALEMLLTGEPVDADEAYRIGLVSKVVSLERLAGEAEALANSIASKGPVALRYVKEAVTKGMDLTLGQGLRLEADLYFLLQTTQDRAEGIRSFLEKRPPRFTGE